MLREMTKAPRERAEPRFRDDIGGPRMHSPSLDGGGLPRPARRSIMGWGAGFLMGVAFLAVLILGGWIALEWFIFPALDKSAGSTASAPILQGAATPDSTLRGGSALTPVPVPKNIPEVVIPLPPKSAPTSPTMAAAAAPTSPGPTSASPTSANPTPASPTPASPTAASPTPASPTPTPAPAGGAASSSVPAGVGETATVGGSGISLRAGPSGTDPVVATRSRGSVLHVFGRQNGWVQLGDAQPVGWGWNGLLGAPAAPAPDKSPIPSQLPP